MILAKSLCPSLEVEVLVRQEKNGKLTEVSKESLNKMHWWIMSEPTSTHTFQMSEKWIGKAVFDNFCTFLKLKILYYSHIHLPLSYPVTSRWGLIAKDFSTSIYHACSINIMYLKKEIVSLLIVLPLEVVGWHFVNLLC